MSEILTPSFELRTDGPTIGETLRANPEMLEELRQQILADEEAEWQEEFLRELQYMAKEAGIVVVEQVEGE